LIIAIPSLGVFAIFRNRVDQLAAEAAYAAQHAILPVKRALVQRRPADSAAPPSPPTPPRSK
jgi:biopolymer transport protein ExbB